MNIVTMYDGTQKELPKGVKLLADVAIGQQGACCVCGEVMTKKTALQNKHGEDKPECRLAYNAKSRRKEPTVPSQTPPKREAANHGNPDAPLQPGEWQRLRSIVRKAGLSLGDHNRTDRYYLVLDHSNNPRHLDYETARMWTQSPDCNHSVLVQAWLKGADTVTVTPKGPVLSSIATRPATSLKLAVARVMVAADSLEQRRAKLARAAELATEAEQELQAAAVCYDQAVEEARAAGVSDQEVGLALAEVTGA